MSREVALERLRAAPVAHLATVGPDRGPHLVPITFAVVGETVVTMIDHKPKTTSSLQRLRNIEADPRASVLVDHYSEDWEQLWWVRVDGNAVISVSGPDWLAAREALVAKYGQYVDRPPQGPAISIGINRIVTWQGSR